MLTFEHWWKSLFQEDAEFLEDFPPGYEGMEAIAKLAFNAGLMITPSLHKECLTVPDPNGLR